MNNILWFVVGLCIGILLCAGTIYYTIPIKTCNSIAGLWTRNNFDFDGDWIHVRVDNKTIEDALFTCKHEVAHELFARHCTENMTKCIEAMEK